LRNLRVQRWWMAARDSHGRGHEVLQEVEGHRSYSATDNSAAAADHDDITYV